MPPRINRDAVLARAAGPCLPAVPDTPHALLRLLRAMSFTLRPDGNHLYVDITAGDVTRAMLEALHQHQEGLLDLVEAFEERAAIAEFCAGLPRVEAEALAWHNVLGKDHTV
jgi:hypothetical protein